MIRYWVNHHIEKSQRMSLLLHWTGWVRVLQQQRVKNIQVVLDDTQGKLDRQSLDSKKLKLMRERLLLTRNKLLGRSHVALGMWGVAYAFTKWRAHGLREGIVDARSKVVMGLQRESETTTKLSRLHDEFSTLQSSNERLHSQLQEERKIHAQQVGEFKSEQNSYFVKIQRNVHVSLTVFLVTITHIDIATS